MARKPSKGKKTGGVGRPRELGPTQLFPLRLPVELHAALKIYAAARGVSLNRAVVEMLSDAWAKVPDKKVYEDLARKKVKK